jgi:outer membrane lipoprotein LolB
MGAAVKTFRISGRIGVRYGGESFSGLLRWGHREAGDEIFILSPLGQGVARIERDAAGVSLVTAEGRTYRARDVETLTQEVLGWRLPLSGLQYWVTGHPAPGAAMDMDFDDERFLRRLRQNGWRVDYEEYRAVQGLALPARLEMANNELTVRLVVDSWSLE